MMEKMKKKARKLTMRNSKPRGMSEDEIKEIKEEVKLEDEEQ